MRRNATILGTTILAVALMLMAGRYMNRASAEPALGGKLGASIHGAVAPAFELKDLKGRSVRLSDYQGKAVLLNFWATWCGPCKIEMPWLVEFQKKYGDQGLQIVGIAMDDASADDIGKFAQQMGVNYPVLLGTETIADQYGGVQGLPTTFYIARNGKVIGRHLGLNSRSDIEDKIKEALGGE